jgi:hypothetical protein
MLLLASCATVKEKPKFELISDLPYDDNYVIELKEFKIGKKYCLWGSKDFDDKCQDAAMEYAYGKNWKEFKKVALNFVKYINAKNAKKLISLFGWGGYHDDYFSIMILNKNKDGVYVPGTGFQPPGQLLSLWDIEHSDQKEFQSGDHIIKGVKYAIRISDEEIIFPDDPTEILEKYLNNIMKDLSKALDETEYKNFLITDNDFGGYVMKISKYITIYFVQRKVDPSNMWGNIYNIPKIRSFDCY